MEGYLTGITAVSLTLQDFWNYVIAINNVHTIAQSNTKSQNVRTSSGAPLSVRSGEYTIVFEFMVEAKYWFLHYGNHEISFNKKLIDRTV